MRRKSRRTADTATKTAALLRALRQSVTPESPRPALVLTARTDAGTKARRR
jgi:hypothetical protein